MVITQMLVKNFGERGKFKPEAIVIHIGEGTKEQIASTFRYEQKSSHYLVCKNGEIWQFVNEDKSAWHAGNVIKPTSKMVKERLIQNPNLWTIGIEHEGMDNINELQYQTSIQLVADICKRWSIPPDREHIIGHREIRADKRCPAKIDMDRIVKGAVDIIYPKPVESVILKEDIKDKEISELRQLISQLLAYIANYLSKLGVKLGFRK